MAPAQGSRPGIEAPRRVRVDVQPTPHGHVLPGGRSIAPGLKISQRGSAPRRAARDGRRRDGGERHRSERCLLTATLALPLDLACDAPDAALEDVPADGPDVGHGIYHSLHDDYLYPYTALVAGNTMIFQGQRSVLTVANESGDYRAAAETYQAYSGNYKLGASAQ